MRNAGLLLSLLWVGAFALSGFSTAYARETAPPEVDGEPLRNNPFSRPAKVQSNQIDRRDEREEAATQLMLTGTLVGDVSFANIGGKVFALGDEVNGQTLVEVHDRYVVLAAENRRVELWVNGDDRSE